MGILSELQLFDSQVKHDSLTLQQLLQKAVKAELSDETSLAALACAAPNHSTLEELAMFLAHRKPEIRARVLMMLKTEWLAQCSALLLAVETVANYDWPHFRHGAQTLLR